MPVEFMRLGATMLALLATGCAGIVAQPRVSPAQQLQAELETRSAAALIRPIAAEVSPRSLTPAPLPPPKLFDYPLARLLSLEQLTPSNNRVWAPELERLATAEFRDDQSVLIRNVRNASWLTATDALVRWEDRTYQLRDLQSVDFVVVPFNTNRSIAHTMLSFGLGKGEFVGISVEVRQEQGEQYNAGLGLARQFELIYVVADERDLLPVRVKQRASDVYLYRCTAAPDKVRALFLDMLQRANQLAAYPEFYDTLTNNCTTNIVQHINRLTPGRIAYDYRVLLPGYSDQLAYDLGLIDTRVSFAEIRRRSWANERILTWEHAPDFSAQIRR